MLLQGTCGVSGQGGIQEEINPNHADSYTDNFSVSRKHLQMVKKRARTNGSNQNTKSRKFCVNYTTKYLYEVTVWQSLAENMNSINRKSLSRIYDTSCFPLIKLSIVKQQGTELYQHSQIWREPHYAEPDIFTPLVPGEYSVCIGQPVLNTRPGLRSSPPLLRVPTLVLPPDCTSDGARGPATTHCWAPVI